MASPDTADLHYSTVSTPAEGCNSLGSMTRQLKTIHHKHWSRKPTTTYSLPCQLWEKRSGFPRKEPATISQILKTQKYPQLGILLLSFCSCKIVDLCQIKSNCKQGQGLIRMSSELTSFCSSCSTLLPPDYCSEMSISSLSSRLCQICYALNAALKFAFLSLNFYFICITDGQGQVSQNTLHLNFQEKKKQKKRFTQDQSRKPT